MYELCHPLSQIVRPGHYHCLSIVSCQSVVCSPWIACPGTSFRHTFVTRQDLLIDTRQRGRVLVMQAALQPISDAEEQLIRELKAVERDLHASPGSSQAQAVQQKARGLQEAINAHVEHVSAACWQGAALHAALQYLSRRLEQGPAARLSCSSWGCTCALVADAVGQMWQPCMTPLIMRSALLCSTKGSRPGHVTQCHLG